MPQPNATGTQGNSRPAPASALSHARKVSTTEGQTSKPAGTKPPAGAARPTGQVPATPCDRTGRPGSAIPCTLRYATEIEATGTCGRANGDYNLDKATPRGRLEPLGATSCRTFRTRSFR